MKSQNQERGKSSNSAFLYTFEAVVASVLLVVVAAFFFYAQPFALNPWDSASLKEKSYDALVALDREGTLRDAALAQNWTLLEYKLNFSLPVTAEHKLYVYNDTALIYSTSQALPENKEIAVSNYLLAGSGYNFNLTYLRLAVWRK